MNTDKKVMVVAYADVVVAMVTGLFISVVNEAMENILVKISTWTTCSDLSVDPDNNDLLLFTKCGLHRIIDYPHTTAGNWSYRIK